MKVFKSKVTFAVDVPLDEDVDLSGRSYGSLLGVEGCHIKGLLYRDDEGKLFADVDISATLTCKDIHSGSPFKSAFACSGDYEILEKEDGEGEGFILPGAALDTADLAFCAILFEMDPYPSKGDDLPESGDGYVFSSEYVE